MEWYLILLIIFCSLFILLLLIGIIIHEKVFGRGKTSDGLIEKMISNSYLKPYSKQINDGMSWLQKVEKEEVFIESYDKLKLKGYYIKNIKDSKNVMILVHGYHSCGKLDFSCGGIEYYKMGFNLLVIDQRSHNGSEGHYTTFGIKERFDLQRWIQFIDNRFSGDVNIMVNGVSMGSSTVMYTMNLDLPRSLKGVICDCGYTVPLDVIRHGIRNISKYLPKYILSFFVDLASIITTGKSLKSINTKETLNNPKVPILIIHGDSDTVVPIKMGYDNYENIKGEKYIKVVKNAKHASSYLVDTENVKKMLNEFINKCLNENKK